MSAFAILADRDEKNYSNPMGAKNNDSHPQKQAIVKFYTLEYRKCGKSNSKNDSRPCMGASAFLKSIDFRAFAVNVKTIAPIQKLYQSGHAIWWYTVPMAVHSFLEEYDFKGKTVIPFVTHGTGWLARTIQDITAGLPDSEVLEPIGVYRLEVDRSKPDVDAWLDSLGFQEGGNKTECPRETFPFFIRISDIRRA